MILYVYLVEDMIEREEEKERKERKKEKEKSEGESEDDWRRQVERGMM